MPVMLARGFLVITLHLIILCLLFNRMMPLALVYQQRRLLSSSTCPILLNP